MFFWRSTPCLFVVPPFGGLSEDTTTNPGLGLRPPVNSVLPVAPGLRRFPGKAPRVGVAHRDTATNPGARPLAAELRELLTEVLGERLRKLPNKVPR